MNKLTSVVSIAAVLLLATASGRAEDSTHRKNLDKASRAGASTGQATKVLQRIGGSDNKAVALGLAQRLTAAGRLNGAKPDYKVEEEKGRTWLKGDGWHMRVADGGNNVRFRAEPDGRARASAKRAQRPNNDQIEAWGRAFIASDLSDLVGRASKADVPYLGSRFEVEIGGNTKTGELAEPVYRGVIAVFGRVIDGVDVIGPGSKVAVVMDIDGKVTGFDVDWPKYQATGETEEAVDIQTVLARGDKLSINEVARRAKGAPETARFECGLFDGGGRNRVRSPKLRFACSAQYSSASKNQQTEAEAVMDVIPAAKVITPEPAWPESMALCKGTATCTGAGR